MNAKYQRKKRKEAKTFIVGHAGKIYAKKVKSLRVSAITARHQLIEK
jgi:hypothetical protein